MQWDWPNQLEGWHEFFVLIGTAGAALTGLLFVVVSVGSRVVAHDRTTGVKAFLSPNAVHFTTTLIVSAICLVPGLPSGAIGSLLCAAAAGSLAYLVSTKAHEHWRRNKLPLLDWIWFVALPLATYGLLLLAGVGFLLQAAWSMHSLAVALILLLVVGIRNAWDIVIWMSRQEHK